MTAAAVECPRPARDARIDFLRGMGILMIALDHFAYLATLLEGRGRTLRIYTYQDLGWSSAAEFFVFLSGYVVALAYGSTLQHKGYALTQARALHRSWQLFAYNALTLLATAACAWLLFADVPALFALTGLDHLQADGLHALARFATLRYSPAYFEILELYIVLIALCPVYLVLVRRSSLTALGLSVVLWMAVQLHPSFNLYRFDRPWNFNPFAWQLLFALGMLSSHRLPLQSLRRLPRRRMLLLLGFLLGTCLVLRGLDDFKLLGPGLHVPGRDRDSLGVLRLLHFLLALTFALLLLPAGDALRRSRAARAVMGVGRHSAESFCLSTLLCYCAIALLARHSEGSSAFLALSTALVALLLVGAWFFGWLKSQPWRGTAAGAGQPAHDSRWRQRPRASRGRQPVTAPHPGAPADEAVAMDRKPMSQAVPP
jgi:hypothetical protein